MKDKVNIVLLPGWNNNSKSMKIFEDKLNRFASLYFIDLPILLNDKSLNIEDYVDYLHKKINHLDNVFILGHSFGGKIASFYALKYKVKGLILIAPSTYIKRSLKVKTKLLINNLFNKLHLPKPKFLKGSNDYKKLSAKEKQTFNNVLKYLSKNELSFLSIPILIIGFNNDNQVKTSDIKYLKKYIRNSNMHLFSGDHFGYFENVHEISYLIGDFIYENN